MINKINTLAFNKSIHNINPKKLGYVCSDGTINFQTAETAAEYSKNKVIQALKNKPSYKKIIVQNNNQILAEINSTPGNTAVQLPRCDKKMTIIEGGMNPVAEDSFDILVKTNNVDEIITYNSRGEFSKLKKNDKHQNFISKYLLTQRQKGNFHRKYNKLINSLLPKDVLMRENVSRFEFKHGSDNNTFREELKAELQEIAKLREKVLQTETGAKVIHKFWVKNASKYGVEYSTNYSNLK